MNVIPYRWCIPPYLSFRTFHRIRWTDSLTVWVYDGTFLCIDFAVDVLMCWFCCNPPRRHYIKFQIHSRATISIIILVLPSRMYVHSLYRPNCALLLLSRFLSSSHLSEIPSHHFVIVIFCYQKYQHQHQELWKRTENLDSNIMRHLIPVLCMFYANVWFTNTHSQ